MRLPAENMLAPLAFACVGTWILFQLGKCIYNLFFHPLHHIPGPWLAAATYLPEFYYDIVQGGRYTRRIQQMHEKYGPIVRISPHEIHCNDFRFINEIYASGSRKRDKPAHQVTGSAGIQALATFSTTSHSTHRLRRNALNKLFSRAQVLKLEPIVRDLGEQLCEKILRTEKAQPFMAGHAYSQCTTDVISGYCLGENLGLLKSDGWEFGFSDELTKALRLGYVMRFVPWWADVLWAVEEIRSLVMGKPEKARASDAFIANMPAYIKKAQAEVATKQGAETPKTTVFTSILQSDLPAQEKTLDRMTSEGISLFAAGTETVSWALTVATFHLISNPKILEKLTAEVCPLINDPEKTTWSKLEGLPYLGAVIHESLRLSYGVASRTARVPTDEDLVYRGEWEPEGIHYVIPRGSAIGMSSAVTHHDERVFPDSHSFIPERWLDEKGQRRKELDRTLLSFSKGSRGCVGINLAYCELHLLLALLVVRAFPHLKLYETTEADVEYDYDFFTMFPVAGSKGVRVVVV
ncbi:cytochrome P450 [Aspergillus mulundensis]|uniref:Putative Cytochrome P450 n=1 Tax=Aspergillus mulundensis TaxID=1810919 RepID=A0A3D8S3Z7_9EURO|nr:putative Cytochrome P450 [Aspergillus mulundensis]RDW81033.1 putative Cytochrome P450 [Aspergillus mulundensis]